MSKVLPFKRRTIQSKGIDSKVQEQAALWLARIDSGASAEDYRQIELWLADDPVHAESFMEMARLWDQVSVLEELSTVFPLEQYKPQGDAKRGGFFVPGYSYGVAATALLMVVALVSVASYFGVDQFSQDFHAHYETDVGEQLTVQLEDGSEIILNTRTSVEVSFDGSERIVTLNNGEALFQVAKDPSRPFQVFAGQQMVEAIGTAFSVHRTELEALEVMVTEGKVMLHRSLDSDVDLLPITVDGVALSRSSLESLSLVAGQFAASTENSEEFVQLDLPLDQLETELSWQHGMLLFRDEPLNEVLAEISRYTTIEMEAAEVIGDVSVGGYFRVNDIEALVAAIENNFEIEVQKINNNKMLFTPRQQGIE